jgi:hypothetical protein
VDFGLTSRLMLDNPTTKRIIQHYSQKGYLGWLMEILPETEIQQRKEILFKMNKNLILILLEIRTWQS